MHRAIAFLRFYSTWNIGSVTRVSSHGVHAYYNATALLYLYRSKEQTTTVWITSTLHPCPRCMASWLAGERFWMTTRNVQGKEGKADLHMHVLLPYTLYRCSKLVVKTGLL